MALLNRRLKVSTVDAVADTIESVGKAAKVINRNMDALLALSDKYATKVEAQAKYLRDNPDAKAQLELAAKLEIDSWIQEMIDDLNDSKPKDYTEDLRKIQKNKNLTIEQKVKAQKKLLGLD